MKLRYSGPVIDPHHHLWDLSMDRHLWLAPPPPGAEMVFGSTAAIARNYLPGDYIHDSAGQNVVATVHVEAGWAEGHRLEETRWLARLDRPGGIAQRLVAKVQLDAPDAEKWLEDEGAFPEVVGIRDIVAWHPVPARSFAARAGVMSDPAFRRGLAKVQNLGLSFDLMLYPWQMDEALDLLRAFPDLTFVLNHCGSPADRTPDGLELWRQGLRRLAAAPNLWLKISDPVAYDPQWTEPSLRMVIDHCLDCFGPGRAMFGSDFPVAGLNAGFDALYAVFRNAAAELSLDEQRALFHDNAARVYRLDMGPGRPGEGA